jgi:hypothetical protein
MITASSILSLSKVTPSSGPSGHLLPAGEKREHSRPTVIVSHFHTGAAIVSRRLKQQATSPQRGEGARRADEGAIPVQQAAVPSIDRSSSNKLETGTAS